MCRVWCDLELIYSVNLTCCRPSWVKVNYPLVFVGECTNELWLLLGRVLKTRGVRFFT